MAKKAIFWDRDGVINKIVPRDNKPSSPWVFEELEILPEAKEFLKKFKALGFLNIIFTNQPDVKRGNLRIEELNKMHEFITGNLPVDDIFYCSHDNKDECQCRKPKPGMILEACKKWNIDPKESYVIGDSWKDIETGNKAGCKTILLSREYNKNNTGHNFIANNLKEVYDILI